MNGLYPLHASAVAYRGRVFAFTGPPGAGKSTLVAALGLSQFVHFCDDTLLLDLSDTGPPLCHPGHKRLKLWPDGAALAGVEAGDMVATHYAKHFVAPPSLAEEPLPLAELSLLTQAERTGFTTLSLGERMAVLDADHQSVRLWLAARRVDRAGRFAELAMLSRRFAMTQFFRPFSPDRFAEGISTAAKHILEAAG